MSQKSSALTVSELTSLIKTQLEGSFSLVTVQGEISNFKCQSSGHYYFDLKDKEAKIPAVCFKGNQRGIKSPPKEGDQITVIGSLSVYPPHGRYQLIVTQIIFSGVGELLLKFEALKKELLARGWFDAARKKKLPPYPKRIGVVTSPTGAVIRDIIHVLRRRYPGFHLILHPVAVQGAGAAEEIAEAIAYFNQHKLADVLIVGRGGGSLEDLWAFNEECVAAAIFASEIPLISAVGHETDVTLSDFVADVRAATPSAAAEIVSAEAVKVTDFLRAISMRLQQSCSSKLQMAMQRVDDKCSAIDRLIKQLLLQKKIALSGMRKEAEALRPSSLLKTHRQKLTLLAKALGSVNPQNVLKRGYAILFDENSNSVIVSKEEIREDQIIKARLADGDTLLCSLKKHSAV